ncbi:MAG: asparagine synthase (glutamine-hydrolyzing) [Candidatus Rickettsia vulgarisii]
MCGIAGIVGKDPLDGIEHSVQMMLDTIAHRGPNGQGMYIDQTKRTVLGHRRLSIIDPALSAQPMHYHQYGLVITFNGCIYNYIELRSELINLGHKFDTNGDTEVILKAYAQWGTKSVEKFNGIFAFAIWDEKNDLLFCSRDRIGVKPFYYQCKNKIFQFCSEIKGLLKSGLYSPNINNQALNNYFSYQFLIENETLFNNIFQLEPGYNLIVKDGEIKKDCYWSIDNFEEDDSLKEDRVIEMLQDLLNDAVKLNLRSDVPIGTYLSGGFDSSSIALLSKILEPKGEIELFTGAFSGIQYDESNYAKLVANHTNYSHHIVYFTADDFAKNMRKIIWHMDEPEAGIGVFPQYMISKFANKHVKVVLGGQGGDEIFAGYTRYFMMMLAENLNKTNKDEFINQALQNKQLDGYQDYFRSFVNPSINGSLEYPDNYFYLIQRSAGLFKDSNINELQEKFRHLFHKPRLTILKKMLRFDIKTHLRALLHVEDRVSMAYALESRVPLLDHRLIELMLRIPSKLLYQDGQKSLFKKAMKPVMLPEIMNRTDKMGFPVPFNQWVHGELREYIIDTLKIGKIVENDFIKKADLQNMLDNTNGFSRALWGALCLELWLQEFMS